MTKLKLVVSEALRSIGANISTSFAATMTVLIGMFLLGLFIAFGSWVVSWSNHVKKELVVHVYFCTADTCAKEASATQINQTARLATANPAMNTCASVLTPGTEWLKKLSEADDELSVMIPTPTATAAAARTIPRKTIRSSPLLEWTGTARVVDSRETRHRPAK